MVVNDGLNHFGPLRDNGLGLTVIATKGGTGAGAARNAGAQGFRGSVLVFVDADVEVTSPDTIRNLVSPILRKEAEATVGSYAPSGRDGVFARYKQHYLAYRYGCDAGLLRNSFWTALCAVDAAWFASAGGFMECYAGAGPEDIELGVALTALHARILPVPDARGYHRSPMTLWSLLANDMCKGTEDVYVHWTRKIPLTDNRHVGARDIAAVFLACALLLLGIRSVFGPLPVAFCAVLYVFVRLEFLLRAFRDSDPTLRCVSVPLTFVLDVVRGGATVAGTALAIAEVVTGTRLHPFQKR